MASVVIPANNESATIERTLVALRSGVGGAAELDVVVVCNGCTDDTAEAARRADPLARVIEVPEPSKTAAVRVGNAATRVFPRVHVDADVELTGAALRLLVAALDDGVLAAAPQRIQPRDGCTRPVRWYYDVWEQLPQVRAGLFGRGVVALSDEGQRRVSALPPMMSDDLVISEVFHPSERRVVEAATVVVHPARTMRALLRRRVRVVTGNAQADADGVRRRDAVTTPRTLLRMIRRQPSLAMRMPFFVAVTLVARWRARAAVRSGDFTTWQRDESSRGGARPRAAKP
ncbi:glycosyltransferase [Nocardioides sp. JQ2195]|nr:glycosyltransferase [Nocardioides sp. JQ2195]